MLENKLIRIFTRFFFIGTATTEIYTLSLHDALPIWSTPRSSPPASTRSTRRRVRSSLRKSRSEEHTSELQSRFDLVCRLLLEKKKKKTNNGLPLPLDHSIHSNILETRKKALTCHISL